MISGMYMGEIVRLALEKLRKHGLLFGGKGSEELSTRGRFYTKYVSEIERFVHLIKSWSVKCTFLAIFNFFKDLKYMYWLKIYTKIHEIVSVCEDFPLFLFQWCRWSLQEHQTGVWGIGSREIFRWGLSDRSVRLFLGVHAGSFPGLRW